MSRPAGTKNRKKPELKVVLDTNMIYNLTAYYLLKHEVYELIRNNAQLSDLIITWYLPDTVRHERQYQMLKQGLDLLPYIQKLEKLLGHNINITEDIIEQRVQEAIDRQITELKINLLPVDSSKVDWERIMLDAVYRRPPFSTSENEKGFRDALICQGFSQLVSMSPTTPKVCRIALVTGDELLTEAVRSEMFGRSNVRILPTIDELKGLINTLVSEVSEEFVEGIKAKASSYFFQADYEDSLYFKENVWKRINDKFAKQLSPPKGADKLEIEKKYIGPPRFIRKERQRIFWVSQITVQVKAYKHYLAFPYTTSFGGGSTFKPGEVSYKPSVSIGIAQPENLPSIVGKSAGERWSDFPLSQYESRALRATTGGSLEMPSDWNITPTKRLAKSGQIVFDVTWSVSVSTKRKSFSNPTIESVEHIETDWT